MLILEKCFLLATPKTGSKWCQAAVLAACRTDVKVRDTPEEYHAGLDSLDENARKKTIAFVRHPLPWYRSYWNHRMRHGWNPQSELDLTCKSEKYEKFLLNVLKHHPGWLSHHVTAWVGTEEAPAEFIGRHEHLIDDLVEAVKRFNVEFDEQVLRETPRTNTGDYAKHPTPCSKELEDYLQLAESKMIDRFYE